MNERPKLKLELTTTDKLLEIFGWVSVVIIWIIAIANYSSMSETIPIHFNLIGKADGFGSKNHIFGSPFIATLLFAGLTILNKFPHIFNYPTHITSENALKQYTIATKIIRYLKLIVVVIFGVIVFYTILY
ncbi:MAG: DUF1648 domain-containing protein [Pseudarcicella sp.]|jgi:uncharacterized membrane protein|nr:DUF1648 domain-containing protein [Pseudarcicella sp.]